MENSMEIPLKTRNKTTIWPSNPTSRHIPRGNQNWKRHMYQMFIGELFKIARTWKQPRCPSTDEWIKKLWYIYTMKYLVQSLSHVQLFATPWNKAHQASPSTTNSWSSLRLTSIESVMPSSHLILCHPLLLLPPIPPSIRDFSNESTLRMR